MKLYRYSTFILIGLVWAGLACNPTRDRKINRLWHSTTGHYNIFFNAETKLNNIVEGIENGHTDDFSKVLEVFPYGDESSGKQIGGQLDEVIKKSSLCIQNHMVGSYTDDAYLLMGKAHYFKRDYYAALEPFQYINSKYKNKGLRPISTAWIAKCYMGLKKEGEAEAVMGLLLSEIAPYTFMGKKDVPKDENQINPKSISKADKAEIYATAAYISIKQQKYALGTEKLIKALSFEPEKRKRIRYTYIIGQLYMEMDSIKLANTYFKKILSMLAPYDFEFNASINLAKAYDAKDKSAVKKVRRSLKRMLNDDKNEGKYDQIWYELGNLEMREKNTTAAIKAYKKAISVSVKNTNQKALSYLALGNIYLDLPDYILAQAYYDSTASSLSKEYKDYNKIIDKKNVLSELIANLIVIETEDSLQRIAALDKSQLEKKIDSWIAAAKQAELQKQKEDKARKEQERLAALNPGQPVTNINSGFAEAGQWYFYNPTIIASGATDFFSQRKWGQRSNTDYWRISSKEKDQATDAYAIIKGVSGVSDSVSQNDEKKKEIKNSISGDRKSWIAKVPFTSDEMKKSNNAIRDAYYNIGSIYDEKLLDKKEASKSFEQLQKRYPDSDYEPEVFYRLVKIYNALAQPSKANDYKELLIRKYPQSPYALILQNKSLSTAETDANKEVVIFYEGMYAQYNAGNYAMVKTRKQEADRKYPGNSLKPKFDLLAALAIGKTESNDSFKTVLTDITKDYPKTDVAERAQAILDYMKKSGSTGNKDSLAGVSEQADFVIESTGTYYYVFAKKTDKTDFNDLVSKIVSYNEEYFQFDNLRANTMMSNDGYQLLYVREFQDYAKVIKYIKDMEALNYIQKVFQIQSDYVHFGISPGNFKKMLKEQKLEAYSKLFKEKFAKEKAAKP